MGDFLFGMAVSVILQVLKELPSDPVKKAKMKKAMLKIRDQITVVYGEEEI